MKILKRGDGRIGNGVETLVAFKHASMHSCGHAVLMAK